MREKRGLSDGANTSTQGCFQLIRVDISRDMVAIVAHI